VLVLAAGGVVASQHQPAAITRVLLAIARTLLWATIALTALIISGSAQQQQR
jgi:hypothetical protein